MSECQKLTALRSRVEKLEHALDLMRRILIEKGFHGNGNSWLIASALNKETPPVSVAEAPSTESATATASSPGDQGRPRIKITRHRS